MSTANEIDDSCSGQRVLVTGGRGFVGRRVVRAFLRAGAEVVVADQRPFGDEPGVTSVVGDLTDAGFRERAMTANGRLDGVVHLAAITSVLKSAEQPQATFTMNVEV